MLAAWELQQEEEAIKREERRILRAGGNKMRGKEKARMQDVYVSQRQTVVGERQGSGGNDSEEEVAVGKEKEELGPLVVFACRHLYHQTCLEKALERQRVEEGKQGDGFRCPIDE